MTRNICLACARNRIRRRAERHVPHMCAGLAVAGLAATAAFWHVTGIAGDTGVEAGTVAAISGFTGVTSWLTGWRPSFRWRRLRRCGPAWALAIAGGLAFDALVILAVTHA